MTPLDRARSVVAALQAAPPYLDTDFSEFLAEQIAQEISAAYAPPDCAAVVQQWYREMSVRFHPDTGGSHEAMAAINEANTRLKSLLGIQVRTP